YPEHILNLYITAVWSSLYRKKFIIENNIRFSMATRVEDNLFAQLALIFAERITFLNRKLLHYRRFFNTSLTDKVDKFWKNSFIVHKEVKDFLLKNGRYELFRRTFMKHFLNHIRYHVIERCHEPYKSFAIEYTKQCLEKDFNLNLYDIKQYVSFETELFYKKIYSRCGNIPLLEKFYTEKKDNIIPIVYAVNEAFVPVLSVSVGSLIKHKSKENFYDIYILHTNLSQDSITRLERISDDNVRVTCINIGKLSGKTKLYGQSFYSKEMFYRFWAPQVLVNYDKILYLDADTVIRTDVAQLYHADMKEAIIAGCVQPLTNKFKHYCQNKLKLETDGYINSGVLLIDTVKWNQANLTDKALTMIKKKGAYVAPDQDILNLICRQNILYLDGRWNCIANFKRRSVSDYTSQEYFEELNVLNDAYILHYTSVKKPWVYFDYLEGISWWHYARNSAFYEYFRYLIQNLHKN
ncbi:MAG: glycosyltransferase family 8 protein, partial [Alphaproteobacteria bacterium]